MKKSPVQLYLTSHIWDFLLCWLAVTGLTLNVFSSFYMEGTLADSIAATLLTAMVCCLLLFLAGYNRKSLMITLPAYTVTAGAAMMWLDMSGTIETAWESGDASWLFFPIVILSALAVYLLTRSVFGTAVLLAAGGVVTGTYRFLLYPVNTPGYILFMGCTALMLLFRSYYRNIMHSEAGKAMFSRYFLQSSAVTAIALAAAGIVVFAVIVPLQLPKSEIKLSTRFMSLEIVEKVGIFTQKQVTSHDLFTNDTNDMTEIVRPPVDNSLDPEDNDVKQEEKQERKNLRNTEAISYDRNFWGAIVIIIALTVLAVTAAILAKRYLRRRRYVKTFALPSEEAVIRLYLTYMKLLRKAGYQKPDSLTWSEYTRQIDVRLSGFAYGEIDFTKLTEIYQRVLYGCWSTSEGDITLFRQLHQRFYAGLKREMGTFRYALNWFVI